MALVAEVEAEVVPFWGTSAEANASARCLGASRIKIVLLWSASVESKKGKES